MSWVAAAVAGGTIVGGYLTSQSQKSAAKDAANAQTASSEAGIAEQRRQFDQIQQLLAPYVNAGTGALAGQQDLLGRNGAAAQQSAIDGIQNSAQFKALQQQGNDAILANASATGGLRGGNTQAALAQFQPQLLSQLIEQQYQRLGGLTSLGQNAAAGTGNAGLQTGNNITQLLGQQGQAQAGAALAAGKANGQFINSLTSAFSTFMGSKF
jgi:hypothetical protein